MKETTLTFIAQSPTPTQIQSSVPASSLIPAGIDWTAVLIPLLPAVFTGVITGLIAPVIAPYTKWHLEKKRRKHERRLQLVETWHNHLQASTNETELSGIEELISLPSFPIIKNQLPKAAKEEFDQLIKQYMFLLKQVVMLGHQQSQEYSTSLRQARLKLVRQLEESPDELNHQFRELERKQKELEKMPSVVQKIVKDIDLNQEPTDLEKQIEKLEDSIQSQEQQLKNFLRTHVAEIEVKWGLI